MMKNNSVPVVSNSANANIDNIITEIKEPTIWIKLIANANNPQKTGKLTSKKTHISPVNIPISALTKNFTFMNLIRSFSIFINVFTDVCLCFKIVLLRSLCTLIDSVDEAAKNAQMEILAKMY